MSIIKVKRSLGNGQPDPGALKEGELAYSLLNDDSQGGNTLYIGTGDTAQSAAVAVGGEKFTTLLNSTAGAVTANKAIIAGTSGALSSITIGDGTTNSTLTNTSLTLTASGLNVIGGNVVFNSESTAETPTAFTITGLPAPDQNSPNDQVATKGYVTSVATGINVSDAESTPGIGNIAGSDVLTFAGDQGVTTSYNDANSTLTIGLQQQLDVDDDVAFGSVTVGSGTTEVLLDGGIIKQLHPQKYHQFVSTSGSIASVVGSDDFITIPNHGFTEGQAVTYVAGVPAQPINNLVHNTVYYAINVTQNTFQLSDDENAPRFHIQNLDDSGGSAVDVIFSASNPVNVFADTDSILMGSPANSTVAIGDNLTVGGNTVIAGNLTVSGETTTVNTSVMQVDDPVLELGEGAVVDTFDRGIKFHYHDGTNANKIGFMGYDKSAGNFTLLTSATDTSQAFTGTKGVLVADLIGNVTGNATTTTGFDSSVLTEQQDDGQGGTVTVPVAGRQITFTGGIASGTYADPNDLESTFTPGPVTWDGTGNISIQTKLATSIAAAVGDYVKDVVPVGEYSGAGGTFVLGDDGSSVVVGSVNNQTNGNEVTVDIIQATTQATAPDIDQSSGTFTAGWKSTQGVASFDSTQFDVTNGWVTIDTIDGGTYGTP